MNVLMHDPVSAAEPAPAPKNLLYAAAFEVTVERAQAVITKALGLDEFKTDVPGFYLPLDRPRDWKLADAATRVIMIGNWLLAEAHEIAERSKRPAYTVTEEELVQMRRGS